LIFYAVSQKAIDPASRDITKDDTPVKPIAFQNFPQGLETRLKTGTFPIDMNAGQKHLT
jgi:hypothetical protein